MADINPDSAEEHGHGNRLANEAAKSIRWCRDSLRELYDAMLRYEDAADSDQPESHRAMMERAKAALEGREPPPRALFEFGGPRCKARCVQRLIGHLYT